MNTRTSNPELEQDMRNVVTEVEDLLTTVGKEGGVRAREAQDRVIAALDAAKLRLSTIEGQMRTSASSTSTLRWRASRPSAPRSRASPCTFTRRSMASIASSEPRITRLPRNSRASARSPFCTPTSAEVAPFRALWHCQTTLTAQRPNLTVQFSAG